ncbi:hypothetical protein TNCV_2453601 [Trichonephila clavipes]|nr:hypothetical protein TNCV_2453601 [Trichonephila clavipes]
MSSGRSLPHINLGVQGGIQRVSHRSNLEKFLSDVVVNKAQISGLKSSKRVDSTTCMVRKNKDSIPKCLPPRQCFANENLLTSSFHDFTETVQGFDKIAYFHHGNDLEATLFSTYPVN